MKTHSLVVFVLFGITVAFAQTGGPPPGPPQGPGFRHGEFRAGGPHFGMHPWKVVTGVPYSATASEEFTQALAGGNSINRTTTTQLARDSQGRTYSEESMAGGPFASAGQEGKIIFISDPSAGYEYVLHPGNKTGVRHTLPKPPSDDAGSERHGPGGMRANANEKNEKVVTSTGSYQDLEVQIKTVTRTIPAGAMGNVQPIVSTTTTYYSPQLQTIVYSVRNDPRFGQSKFSLTNISQSEPDAKLFVPPSDYSIKDAAAMHPPDAPR